MAVCKNRTPTYVEQLFLATDDAGRKRRIVERMCSVPLGVAVAVMRGVVAWTAWRRCCSAGCHCWYYARGLEEATTERA
jgi:hypothetical protein